MYKYNYYLQIMQSYYIKMEYIYMYIYYKIWNMNLHTFPLFI